MPGCLISFGANIGDSLGTIRSAATALRLTLGSKQHEFRLSRFFRTPPIGGPSGQPPFVNAVAAVQTQLTPWEIWHAVREVEHDFGRRRQLRWEARRIDIDVLLYDDQRIWTPHFKIPHPRFCMRRFILVPATDVAPQWIEPVSGLSIQQLAARLNHGAGSLLVLGQDSLSPESMLQEVARQEIADWRQAILDRSSLRFPHHPSQPGNPNHSSNPDPLNHSSSSTRTAIRLQPQDSSPAHQAQAGPGDSTTQYSPSSETRRWVACLTNRHLGDPPFELVNDHSSNKRQQPSAAVDVNVQPGSNRGSYTLGSADISSAGSVRIITPQSIFSITPAPKLTVLLTPPVAVEDVAWEDYHRSAALAMNMAHHFGSEADRQRAEHVQAGLLVEGPKYLLATDDREWAIHEMAAALDAMDCPVEPIVEPVT